MFSFYTPLKLLPVFALESEDNLSEKYKNENKDKNSFASDKNQSCTLYEKIPGTIIPKESYQYPSLKQSVVE